MGEPRLTGLTVRVLAILAGASGPCYGRELAHAAGIATGTLYPMLARLIEAGWIEARWENPAEAEGTGRPRRHYYGLTTEGAAIAGCGAQNPRGE
ncbi:PadR family transcriptional regulator [Streptacidiphilus sp. EB103A]|uniref:PadR family transcriptional regulator n=1 Tax=Streptacidiphilus sp. EB103A TaxID=3156275 RepID=UPI003514D6B1